MASPGLFCFQFLKGGAAQKIAEQMTFPTKKVAKYSSNSLKFALMTLFCISISRGGGGGGSRPRAWEDNINPDN